ncbi:MAG: PTS sugar transporter subunit IIC/EAL domain-containing protein [Firmicutes bacterium]|nr:PTS sugar transporter subunit IIC/EAL domain-containing protein [Bacillota bacterium]
MKNTSEKNSFIDRVEQMTVVRSVRDGLSNMVPVLTIGAFALILQTFPVTGYQTFIATFADGFLLSLFKLIYSATFGVLSVYMTYFISRAFLRLKADPEIVKSGGHAASLLSFFILAGAYLTTFGTDSMGPKSMFLAILTGLGASELYLVFCRLFNKGRHTLLTTGADREFNKMLSTLFPTALVAVIFALFNALVIRAFGVDSFRTLLAQAFNRLFAVQGSMFTKGFFFVFLSSALWFFGIHGSDTLEGVMQTYFAPGLAANKAAIAAGTAPTTVLTKGFFDCFVLMGGCGAAICLLISILLFSRNRARRGLGFAAAFPMAFNINELMVFGLPIILNPLMLIPFLTVPLVCYSVSYAAISSGIVPMITNEVEWTTPILLGGFRATGSAMGLLLQFVNVVIGVAIYTPFVRRLDRLSEEESRRDFNDFMAFYRANEAELIGTRLTERGDAYGNFAKGLLAEMRGKKDRLFTLYYQPQYHYDGRCIGVETLLRWQHPVHGNLYPPLVMHLAEEGGFLAELEEAVIERALAERPKVLERFGKDIKFSFNVTGTTVVTPRFLAFIRKLNERDPFEGKNIYLEVTEQAAISFNEETLSALRELREMGLLLAIDDFSMGQTSVHYMKDTVFNMIKLDGSLVRSLSTHENAREIVSSIIRLAGSLDMTVLAEYVETEEEREMLHSCGCDNYQGYLYSQAVPLEGPAEKDA